MGLLGDLDDLDLSTIELEDGTPLLASWKGQPESIGADRKGVWVAQGALPASAVMVDLDTQANRLTRDGLYPETLSLQDLVTSLLRDGFNAYRKVTDDDPDDPTQARSFLVTDYRRSLSATELGSNGSMFGLSYGSPKQAAGGFANCTTIVIEVRGSEDPVNEIGGCIASMQLGRGGEPPPTASLWGSSYTLRGSVGRQPGGLMAYTAVVQNYFNGSGSRSANYGFAAVTRPGIGDGADFHVHDPIRDSTTYPVDFGFVVCGDSGPVPEGGGIGYRVAFQAGGAASPWAPADQWRSRIGTGLLVRDWLEGGIHVHPPHPDAADAAHVRLDRREGQLGNLLECRTEDGRGVLLAARPDGRLTITDGRDPSDAVTRSQLEASSEALRNEMRDLLDRLPAEARLAAPGAGLSNVTSRTMISELAQRALPTRIRQSRLLRRSAQRVRRSGPARP